MKKIITVLASVLLLCGMVFSMASCFGLGKVDMAELKTALEARAKTDNNVTAYCDDKTDDKSQIKRYSVSVESGDETYGLYIVEFANKKLAKLYVEYLNHQLDSAEKENKLQKKMNEALVEVGAETDEIDELDEVVIKRKGTVVIYGDKAAYDALNDMDDIKSLI